MQKLTTAICSQVNTGRGQNPKTLEEWIVEIPDQDTREFFVNTCKEQRQYRKKLIKELSSNERCAFDKGELQAMKTDQLEKLAASLKPEDYNGVGEVPPPPPVVLAKDNTK